MCRTSSTKVPFGDWPRESSCAQEYCGMKKISFAVFTAWVISQATCQRLSQGASDWYMRFHDFDFVKRNVDHPVIKNYHVEVAVRHRYAITKVSCLLYNPATVRQPFKFGFAMPKKALVSDVILKDRLGTVVVTPTFNKSDWLPLQRADEYADGDSANGNGRLGSAESASRTAVPPDNSFNELAEFKQFVLPIHIPAGEETTVILIFEHLLEKRDARFFYGLNISPGQLVKDFNIRLDIEENDGKALQDLKVTAPVMGDMSREAVHQERDSSATINLNMSIAEQYHYFGNHGFTGDFVVEFDVSRRPGTLDVASSVKDNTFLHFFDLRDSFAPIPKHVIFVLDNSDSMRGAKLDDMKGATKLLTESLDAGDFINVLVSNKNQSRAWNPISKDLEALPSFPVAANISQDILSFVDEQMQLGNETGEVGFDIVAAIEDALILENTVRRSDEMPRNALSFLVIMTDGSLYTERSTARAARKKIKQMNKSTRLPIILVGMGFDANMNFLENIAAKSGGCSANVIHDLSTETQLSKVVSHLNDVVIKNLELRYLDESGVTDLTSTRFERFHQGSAVAVAGRWETPPGSGVVPEIQARASGLTAEGVFEQRLFSGGSLLPPEDGCQGSIRLCSKLSLKGECLTVSATTSNLARVGFSNRAASFEVIGECGWEAFAGSKFRGLGLALQPGVYEAVPQLHRKASSLRKILPASKRRALSLHVHEDEFVARAWAFLAIHAGAKELDSRPVVIGTRRMTRAVEAAVHNHFLTPFTDLYLHEIELHSDALQRETYGYDYDYEVEPSNASLVEQNFMSYGDLSPVFVGLDDPDLARQWDALKECESPIVCNGNFHIEFEQFPRSEPEGDVDNEDAGASWMSANCTGTIRLFTQSEFRGEELNSTASLSQVYHSLNAQRMRSIRADGDCCWLIFELRFFAGSVERICGSFEQSLRVANVGSVKRIG